MEVHAAHGTRSQDAGPLDEAGVLRRPLGASGIVVTPLGLGAMQLGDPDLPDAEAERLLHGALDLGCAVVDTARAYGCSEARIGRFLERRRDEYVLSTKVGYGVDGVPDWTPASVRLGIDRARDRLRTDYLDIVHLHSCDLGTLQHGGVTEALAEAVRAGKARLAAYSGEGAALEWAIESGAFQVVQASVNFLDQAALHGTLAGAAARGVGVLAKRPLATAPWTGRAEPEYLRRFRMLQPETGELGADWSALAIRFAAFAPGVHCCLVGTRSLAHLKAAVAALRHGPLEASLVARLGAAYRRLGSGWQGVV
jgi:aryl-alcohol dehydrogenase-like predicted oxidoreductase